MATQNWPTLQRGFSAIAELLVLYFIFMCPSPRWAPEVICSQVLCSVCESILFTFISPERMEEFEWQWSQLILWMQQSLHHWRDMNHFLYSQATNLFGFEGHGFKGQEHRHGRGIPIDGLPSTVIQLLINVWNLVWLSPRSSLVLALASNVLFSNTPLVF